jgi:hypothetical protein
MRSLLRRLILAAWVVTGGEDLIVEIRQVGQ